jgi:hypothetical protein
VRTAFLLMVLSGCVENVDVAEMERVRGPGAAIAPATTEENLCGLAAELPATDPCSMICDPEALKNVLLSEGQAAGRCYEFSCSFAAEKVSFGVCLDGQGPRPIPRTAAIM